MNNSTIPIPHSLSPLPLLPSKHVSNHTNEPNVTSARWWILTITLISLIEILIVGHGWDGRAPLSQGKYGCVWPASSLATMVASTWWLCNIIECSMYSIAIGWRTCVLTPTQWMQHLFDWIGLTCPTTSSSPPSSPNYLILCNKGYRSKVRSHMGTITKWLFGWTTTTTP